MGINNNSGKNNLDDILDFWLIDDIEITSKEIDSALDEFSKDYGYILKRPRDIQILKAIT